jgi:hypothetical protein
MDTGGGGGVLGASAAHLITRVEGELPDGEAYTGLLCDVGVYIIYFYSLFFIEYHFLKTEVKI